MAKSTKASKTSEVTDVSTSTAASAVPVPVVVVSAPETTVVTKVKKVKSVKQEAVAVELVVAAATTAAAPTPVASAAPVAAADSVAVAAVEDEVDATLVEKTREFYEKLQQIGALLSSMKTDFKTLDKQWSRELKTAQKQSSKRKRKAGNRAPSGFVKPTRISDELASFLEKPSGSEMARTEVTRDINKYIRTNLLQDKDNGRKIIPDAKLSALLKIQKGDELTYFNLQRYMSPHFSKADKAVVAAV